MVQRNNAAATPVARIAERVGDYGWDAAVDLNKRPVARDRLGAPVPDGSFVDAELAVS